MSDLPGTRSYWVYTRGVSQTDKPKQIIELRYVSRYTTYIVDCNVDKESRWCDVNYAGSSSSFCAWHGGFIPWLTDHYRKRMLRNYTLSYRLNQRLYIK